MIKDFCRYDLLIKRVHICLVFRFNKKYILYLLFLDPQLQVAFQ